MKISIVSHTYPTHSDPSIGIFIQKEAQLISTFADVNVHIPAVYATPFNSQFYRSFKPVIEKFKVFRFHYFSSPRRSFPSVTQKSISKKLLESLKKSDTDIVHLHWLFPAGLAATQIKKEGYPVIITLHGGDWYSNISNDKIMSLLYQSLQSSDYIIIVGKQLKKDVVEKYPEFSAKIRHIPHGIDSDIFLPPKSKSEAKSKVQWNENKFNLLCVANLYPVKDVPLLIKAFAQSTFLSQSHLHIVAPRFHIYEKNKVTQLISDLSIKNKITFYSAMSENNLISFYQAADIFISPSKKEGFGLAIAEAASCGVPVVATRSGGPEEIISEEIGKLANNRKPDTLRQEIDGVLSEPNQFNPLEMNNYIRQNFSLNFKRSKLKEAYSSLL